MGQLTKEFVERLKSESLENRCDGLTMHEINQLANAWLDRENLRAQAALPDADQSSVPIFRGFAVVNSQGYFEGIWREYATAELWANKQRDKGRIVEMEAIRARHK